MKRLLIAALGLGALAIGACGGRNDDDRDTDGGPQPDGGTGALTLDEYASESALGICAYWEECFGPIFVAPDFGRGRLPCEEWIVRDSEERDLPTWRRLVAAGTVVFDPVAARACLDTLAADPCDEEVPPACDEALAGQVEEGGDCTDTLECVSGTFCDLDAACPGRCAPARDEGCPCEWDTQCAEPFWCYAGVCAPLAANGERCLGGLPDCLTGICVDGDSGTSGTCRPASDLARVGEGEACDAFEGPFCEEGLACAWETSVCVAPSERGGACEDAWPDPCPSGEECRAGTCVPLPTAGELCASAGCAPGAVCDELRGHCDEVGGAGAPCASDRDCWSGECSDLGCAAPLACPDGDSAPVAAPARADDPVVTVETTCDQVIPRLEQDEDCGDPAPSCPEQPPAGAETVMFVHYCSFAAGDPACDPVYGPICAVEQAASFIEECVAHFGVVEAELPDGSRELRWVVRALGGASCEDVVGEAVGILGEGEPCCTHRLEIHVPHADRLLIVEIGLDWAAPPAECS